PACIFGQDAQLRYQWICGRLFGRPVSECLGKDDSELLSPQSAEALAAVKREVLSTGRPVRRTLPLEVDRREIIRDFYLKPLRHASGELTGLNGVTMQTRGKGTTDD